MRAHSHDCVLLSNSNGTVKMSNFPSMGVHSRTVDSTVRLSQASGMASSEMSNSQSIQHSGNINGASSHTSVESIRSPKLPSLTKEKQRRTRHQAHDQSSDQRRKRCLHCKLHSSNPGCFGYPRCKRCILFHKSVLPRIESMDQWRFLDWRHWLAICQKLSEQSSASPIISTVSYSVSNAALQFSKAIVLEFSFHDKLSENICYPHIVVFRPDEQELRASDQSSSAVVVPRGPALVQAQLDELVKKEVWGLALWESDGKTLPPDELELWTAVRLVIGYFALMHNLSTTFIQASNVSTVSLLGRISAELIYAIGFRLQMLYTEIMSFQDLHRHSEGTSRSLSAVKLYGYEVMYRCVSSMQKTDWKISDPSPQNPLHQLQSYFNRQVKQILCHLADAECRDSANMTRRRIMRPAPAMIGFARSMTLTSFPQHCVITVSQHRTSLPLPLSVSVPCSWNDSPKYRSIDIAGTRLGDFFSPRLWYDAQIPPSVRYLDEKNTMVQVESLLAQRSMAPRSENSHSTMSETNVTCVFDGLDFPDGRYCTDFATGDTTSPEGSDLPSLCSPESPLSLPSPETPTSIPEFHEL
ncbi:hypothetical protein R6Q59_009835 [Mikania micrantha]